MALHPDSSGGWWGWRSTRASLPKAALAMMSALAALMTSLALLPASAQAAPQGFVLNTNQSLHSVDLGTNAEVAAGSIPFASDSLALSPSGVLYAADPAGNLWDVTGPPIPVGPTGRSAIGDLDWAGNGLWGYANGSNELFFFDLASSSVTAAFGVALPAGLSPAAVVNGVAYQPGSGDIFLAASDGLNNDHLLRVPAASATAVLVGSLSHGDSFSVVSDIDFDAAGTLYAMTWFHRWFYSVSPTTAATVFLSSGPHRDTTGLALSPVPEPASVLLFLAGAALLTVCSRAAGDVAARARPPSHAGRHGTGLCQPVSYHPCECSNSGSSSSSSTAPTCSTRPPSRWHGRCRRPWRPSSAR